MSTDRANLNLLRAALDAAGATLPKSVASALADLDKITATVAELVPPSGQELGDAIAAAILAGKHPADDATVSRLVTVRALTGEGDLIARMAADGAERRVNAALTDERESIAEKLQDAGRTAGQTLTDAHAILGDVDLDDGDSIARLGPDSVRVWADAKDAMTLLRTLDRGAIALAALTTSSHHMTGAGSTLRLSGADLEVYERVGRNADAWQIVCAGGTIDLAGTAPNVAARSARLSEQRDERARAHAEAMQAKRPSYLS